MLNAPNMNTKSLPEEESDARVRSQIQKVNDYNFKKGSKHMEG